MKISDMKEKIYFSKTKEYFEEVEKSFYNNSYRSSTVMLYSVIIADIIYKLEELRDLYQDGTAIDILKNMKKSKEENITSSDWEFKLIDEVYKRTDIIESFTYTNIEYLKKLRNFSAHPAFNNNNELIAPTREIIEGLIIEMLEEILTRPPMFASKVTDLISNDISEKKWIFIDDENKFQDYLKNKYFKKMQLKMKLQIFKDFWKFTFRLDNDDCNQNRKINLIFLKILLRGNKLKCYDYIKDNLSFFNQISNNPEINKYLIELMYFFPELYDLLDDTTRTTLEVSYNEKTYLNIISYYKYDTVEQFMNSIKHYQINESDYVKMLEKYMLKENYKTLLYDKYVEICNDITSFNEADYLFSEIILNNIEKMNKEQIICLIKNINNNSQIYNRNRAYSDNNVIVEKVGYILGETFNYDEYKNFKFSKDILNKIFLPF